MSSAQASETPGSPTNLSVSSQGGVKEWFWRGQALATAKAAPKASSLRRERLRRARLAAELGDRTIDPAEPLRDGSALPLAITLFREAAYWALLSHSDADIALLGTLLVDKTFVETAEDRADALCKEADLAQAFVHGLIQSELDAEDKVTNVLVQRWVRVGILAAIFGAVLFMFAGVARRAVQGPDLAAGKPWKASSKAFECHPKDMECGGARSAMFFHTVEEEKPWVEFDLNAPTTFSRLEVVNREDCCPERAVPLIVEASDDHNKWTEIARRNETFREWEATFNPTTARYVRLRVDRRTSFHLVRVTLRAR